MILDAAFIFYCCFNVFRSRRRKLSETIYRLVRMLIAVCAGVSLFKLLGGWISTYTGNFFPESLGFLMAFILPLIVLRLFRHGLSNWIENGIGQANASRWGMLAGLFHSLFVVSALLIPLALSQSSQIYRFFAKGSLVLRFFTFVVNPF